MQSTVDQELALRAQGKGSSLINDLKAAILAAELKQTDDFRSSIFTSFEQDKQGEILGDGTSYELPAYDLDLLKKGEAVGDGTELDLPSYDLDSLKKGEVVGEGSKLDLSTYDLDLLKKGESLGDGTKLDLPSYYLDTLKKEESVGEGTELDLPPYDLDSLKNRESVSKDNRPNFLNLHIDDSKNNQEINSNNKSTETNSYKKKEFTKLFKFDAKMNNRHVSATSTNNASLPKAGSKNSSFAVVLVGISSLFTALGLNI